MDPQGSTDRDPVQVVSRNGSLTAFQTVLSYIALELAIRKNKYYSRRMRVHRMTLAPSNSRQATQRTSILFCF